MAETREDRMFSNVEATIPPLIARLDYAPSLQETLAFEQALLTVAQVDTDADGHSAALSRFMVRSESVASSKIERINASARDYAKAVAQILMESILSVSDGENLFEGCRVRLLKRNRLSSKRFASMS